MEVSSFVTTLVLVILAISTTTNATKGGKYVEKPKAATSFLPLTGLVEETTTEESTTEEPELEGRSWGVGTRDPCHLPKEKGKCKGKLKRYFFDIRIMKCVEFEYGGCGGNLNKFEDKNACRAACEKPNLAVPHAETTAIKKPKTTTNLHSEMTTTSPLKKSKPKKNSTTTTAPKKGAGIEGRTLEGKEEDKGSKPKHGKSPDHPSTSGKKGDKKDKKGKESHESDSGKTKSEKGTTTKKPKNKGHH